MPENKVLGSSRGAFKEALCPQERSHASDRKATLWGLTTVRQTATPRQEMLQEKVTAVNGP